ncbi:MAG: FAD-dependent oxidoreductase [Labilithrix sp.]|nr:FAD-dependent oxidoreductase [Labilithrix sp.]MCW5809671.1 FAD-dependent oxidoreductase [Labilithrix sp.]
MKSVKTLIVGAGITGLATAAALGERGDEDYLVLEADGEIGGYCKTIKKEGFVWDYSGHFFHFKHKEIEEWLRARMPKQRILDVVKRSFIEYKGKQIDFPFQKNIHQLPQSEFIDCLHDLYFAPSSRAEPEAPLGGPGRGSASSRDRPRRESSRGQSPLEPDESFQEMLYARFGRSIAEKFLIPYNEKLYACDLGALDKDAMGRFFPHANLTDIVRNMKVADNATYNARFTYPEGGAIEYVKALASAVRPDAIALKERLMAIDLATKTAKTDKREIRFERLVSSAPFNKLLTIARVDHDPTAYSWNKVLVFNLGFDKKGQKDVHWVYFPDRETVFYRVGFYDNIFDADRLSLYVEIGFAKDATIDVEVARARVLADLEKTGVTKGHRLVAEHHVVMDPAYVHVTQRSIAEHARHAEALRARGVHSAGRYGGWTYCSIEDNIVEARALVAGFARGKT